jgi:ketosteroid isomerase-like protein
MKNSVKLFTLITIMLLFISSITSCNKKVEETKETVVEPTFNLTTAKAEIVKANKEFMELFTAIDSVGLSNLYTEDAKFMMNGAPAISGRENIQSTISAIMNSGVSSVNLTTVDVWGTENFITEEGGLSLFVGDDEVDKGKYIVLWKKENGKWKLFRDIFNSNLPAE